MANIKITQLPTITTLSAQDLFIVDDVSQLITHSVSMDSIANYVDTKVVQPSVNTVSDNVAALAASTDTTVDDLNNSISSLFTSTDASITAVFEAINAVDSNVIALAASTDDSVSTLSNSIASLSDSTNTSISTLTVSINTVSSNVESLTITTNNVNANVNSIISGNIAIQTLQVLGNTSLAANTLFVNATSGNVDIVGSVQANSFIGGLAGNADTATILQTARTIGGVTFDGSANINLPGVNIAGTQNTSGSAATITVGRTISLTGDVTYTSNAFDGSADVTGIATLANVGTPGTYAKVTTDAAGRVTTGANLESSDIPNLDASKITSGIIDAARLPSYVNAVLEYADVESLPASGETGKLYVALNTNKVYRWSGSTYIAITSGAVDSVAGRTGLVTLTKDDVGLSNVDNTADSVKSVASAAALSTGRLINGVMFDGTANITLATVNTSGNQSIAGIKTFTDDAVFNSTGAVKLPAGTEEQRPTGVAGQLRFNASTGQFEGYNGLAWGAIGGDLEGNSATASALQTAREIAIDGVITGSVLFDGSANVTITAAQVDNSIELGTHTTGSYVANVAATANTGISVTGSGSETAAVILAGIDASTTVKGVASFSANNFSVSNGTVSIDTIYGGTY